MPSEFECFRFDVLGIVQLKYISYRVYILRIQQSFIEPIPVTHGLRRSEVLIKQRLEASVQDG